MNTTTPRGSALRLLWTGLILCLAVLVLAGCGDDNGDGGGSAGGGGSAESADKEQVNIAMEMPISSYPYDQIKAGAEQAAKDDGAIDVEVQAPNSIDPSAAQAQARALLAKSPDGMGIAPFPPEVWGATLNEIAKRVPNTITWTTKPAGTKEQLDSSPIKTFVGTSDIQGGREVANEVIDIAKIPEDVTGTVLIGQCVAGESGIVYERIQGVRQAVEERLPNAKVVVFDAKVDPQANASSWGAAMNKYKDDVVLTAGVCAPDGPGQMSAKKRLNLDVPSIAMEPNPQTVQGVEDGSITATYGIGGPQIGYVVVKLLSDAARGGKIPEGWIDSGYDILTKENVAEIKVGYDPEDPGYMEFFQPRIDKILADVKAGKVQPLTAAYE